MSEPTSRKPSEPKRPPQKAKAPQVKADKPKKRLIKTARPKAAPKKKAKSGNKLRPSAPIVPPQTVAGRALALVVAIMSFLACLTVGAVSLVWDAADDWQNDLVREITIQIRPIDGVDMLREIDKAMALTMEFPGIESVQALSDEETRKLLEPWLGEGLQLDALPVPRLIQISVDDPSLLDMEELRTTLVESVRGASLDDHSVWTSRLAAMAGAVVLVGFGILSLVLGSMVLSVVFATQAAMAGNKDVVSVLHFVGAEDTFIAREFQRHFLVLGLRGGVIGGLVAVIVFVLLGLLTRSGAGYAGADQFTALFGSISVSTLGYVGVVAVVALVAFLTSITSRWAVKAHLRKVD